MTITIERGRELLAELELLADYDRTRLRLGYDYGNGQRAAELGRRRLELSLYSTCLAERGTNPGLELSLSSASREELAGAWKRVGRRRLRAAERSCRSYGTRSARKTLEAWETIERRYRREEP